jgi:hypothetical protein
MDCNVPKGDLPISAIKKPPLEGAVDGRGLFYCFYYMPDFSQVRALGGVVFNVVFNVVVRRTMALSSLA